VGYSENLLHRQKKVKTYLKYQTKYPLKKGGKTTLMDTDMITITFPEVKVASVYGINVYILELVSYGININWQI
jgi:hypothetical protein